MITLIRKQFIVFFLLFTTCYATAEEQNVATETQERWSYFGKTSETGEVIQSNFSPVKDPSEGDLLTVTHDISVRISPPSAGYEMGQKVDALASGTQVKVVSVFKFPGANRQSLIWINTQAVE